MINPSTEMRITFDAFNEMVDLDQLQEHPQQTNTHTKEQEIRLALVMKEHGVSQAIHVVKGTKTICFGHLRKMAALRNGWTKYPVVYQTFANKAEEIMKVTSDNAIASWAEINLGKVNEQMIDLGPDINPDLFGIENFVIEPADKFAPGCDEDEVPEHVEPKTKLGDVYKLGNHRLMCGDSTSIDAVEKLMNGEKADMVFTDPPYGISIVKLGTVGASSKIGFVSPKNAPSQVAKAREYKAIKGDDEPFDPGLILGLGFKTIILWGANHYASRLPDRPQWLIWDKKLESGLLDHNNFSDCELAWTNQTALSAKIYRHTWAGMLRKGERKEELKDRVHPTQKPVGLCSEVISDFSDEGQTIIDVYGGSGSTLIACEKTNRKCFMIELDPHYCSVIIERWKKYTGKEAYRVESNGDQTPWSEITI